MKSRDSVKPRPGISDTTGRLTVTRSELDDSREDVEDQHRSVELFPALHSESETPDVLDYAVRHREIIERFDRFPHRNEVLGHGSTPGETFSGSGALPF